MYSPNKYIANILKAYVKDENNNANNSATFFNYIGNVLIEGDEIKVSFDDISLYTNIHTLNIIKDYVNNDYQFTRKTAVPQDKFLDLVNYVLTNIWYNSNPQFYQQTDSLQWENQYIQTQQKFRCGSRANWNNYGTTPSKSLGTICW